MDEIISAVNSTQSPLASVNIKAVSTVINSLKQNGKEHDVKAFLERANFETTFEKLVAVKLINAFKLNDNLINAFSTEDLFVISQGLKCDWFFEDHSEMLSDKELVLNFISKLSYSGRCKIIKKYMKTLKNTDKAEKLTLILDETFGIKTALELLPACSEPFITDFLYSKDIKMSERYIEQLYLKHPDFTIDYIFSFYEKKKPKSLPYRKILLKIASEKTSLFIEFWNKYGEVYWHDNKFGRSLTHKILKLGYSSVLRHSEKYFAILNMKFVVWYLSRAQLEELHFCLLPKNLTKFNESYNYAYCGRRNENLHISLLQTLKNHIAKEILMKNFKKKYGKDPLDANLSKEMIDYFPQEIKAQWAENKLLDKDLDDSKKAEFAVYLPFDQAFKALKTLIPLALDNNSRIHIIRCMMQNVINFKHYEGVSQVVIYIVSRLRNDSIEVRGQAILGLSDMRESLDLSKLTVDQWAPIIELVNIFTMNDEILRYSNEISHIYGKWIICRLDAGLPIDSEMEIIMDYSNYYFDFNIAPGTKYEAVCLEWFNNNLLKKKFANDREKLNFTVRLFCAVNDFNVSHPDCSIKQNDWVIEVVKDKISENYSRGSIISSLEKNKPLMYEVYNAIFPKIIFPEILLHKYSHNINDIVENVDIVVSEIMKGNINDYKPFLLKILLCKELPGKMSESCLKFMNSDPENALSKFLENGVILLSLLNPDMFLSFIKNYYPTGPKAENDSTEARQIFRMQTAITVALKNINPPYKSLDAVKKFSVGDYLKLVLGSMLSVSQKISQTRAVDFIKDNLDTPISYRKHIIRIFKLVASKSAFTNVLLSSVKNEKNVSLRAILFNIILDLVKEEKNQFAWNIVKQAFPTMTDADMKQLQPRLFSLNDIPSEYQAEYIDIMWATLLRIEASFETKAQIFSLINEHTISLISDNFADLLFGMTYKTLKDDSVRLSSQWNKFISLYLCICPKEYFEKRLNNVIGLVKNELCLSVLKKANSEDVKNLVEEIANTSLFDGIVLDPLHILSSLSSHLLKIFPEHEIHQMIFKLSLYQTYLKNNRSNINGFADDVCGLVDLNCTMHGPYIIPAISSNLESFFYRHFQLENVNVKLIFSHRLITGPTSPPNKILGVTLLCNESIDREVVENRKMFDSIVETIDSSSDHSLKIHAKAFSNF